MTKIKHTEQSIIDKLRFKYNSNILYKLNNAYIFKNDWESDFFIVQKQSGYCYEFEIKISRADFFNDMKKATKHSILSKAEYTTQRSLFDEQNGWSKKEELQKHTFRPNKFFYVVPEGLIKKEEVPPYAGLMYIDDVEHIRTVKEAKFIHKEKLKFESTLCLKFYYYWIDKCNEVRSLKQMNEYYKQANKELEQQLEKLKNGKEKN